MPDVEGFLRCIFLCKDGSYLLPRIGVAEQFCGIHSYIAHHFLHEVVVALDVLQQLVERGVIVAKDFLYSAAETVVGIVGKVV